jgi:hypothetical protein
MIIALRLFAQSASPDGAALYKQHCSTSWCHGTAGRASALAAMSSGFGSITGKFFAFALPEEPR